MVGQAPFSPGTLWARLRERTDRALADGMLVPIATRREVIEQDGVAFQVHVAENLERKRQEAHAQAQGRKPADPFLPPESALTVAAVPPHHLAVLNKFNVVEHHLLVVTRRFEDQQTLLSGEDFEALWRCLDEYPALGFYNGGRVAGASQRHKHLQLIPLPLDATAGPLPIEARFGAGIPAENPAAVPGLPFAHRLVGVDPDAADRVRRTRILYLRMLDGLGIVPQTRAGAQWQSAPYNLLLTREWMLVVPRSREHAGTVSINAMGFAGSLFVRDEEELAQVRETGPMRMLEAVV